MRFTVLIPTFNNGDLIRCAIRSVLRQTRKDFELLVVSDGAPARTHRAVEHFAKLDSRVRLLKYKKGQRHGELSRHDALLQATGEAVCYLSDDDFWFPDHLAVMERLLRKADFAHTRHASLIGPHHVMGFAGSLNDPEPRRAMMETKTNIFGLSFAGHRMDAYKKLPEGWSPAPDDIWTDLNMWRKWLSAPDMRYGSSPLATGLNLPATWRKKMTPEARIAEQKMWYEIFGDPFLIEALRISLPKTNDAILMASVAARANKLRRQKPPLKKALRQLIAALR